MGKLTHPQMPSQHDNVTFLLLFFFLNLMPSEFVFIIVNKYVNMEYKLQTCEGKKMHHNKHMYKPMTQLHCSVILNVGEETVQQQDVNQQPDYLSQDLSIKLHAI